MKTLLRAIFLLSISICLWGCPYESPYALDPAPRVLIDENLLGKWAAMVKRPSYEGQTQEAPVKVIIDSISDTEYRIGITGYIQELKYLGSAATDTFFCTGYLSQVDNRRFLNLMLKGRVYIAEVLQQPNSMSMMMLAEQFTNKLIRNCSELRQAVSIHYRSRAYPVYDEWFVLKNLQKVN